MSYFDPNRPYRDHASMDCFDARHQDIARKFGKRVKAMVLSNREYKYRFDRLADKLSMKPPPSSVIHIMLGYLVVRKLGTPHQYETWMPDDVFEELYVQPPQSAVPVKTPNAGPPIQ